MIKTKSLLSIPAIFCLLTSIEAHAFAREFTQDKHPSVFHPENSNAELCLFVYRRQGALLIQPHCMVSVSSHQVSLNKASKADR